MLIFDLPAVLEATATSVLDGIICLQPQRSYRPTSVELDSIQYYERTLRAVIASIGYDDIIEHQLRIHDGFISCPSSTAFEESWCPVTALTV